MIMRRRFPVHRDDVIMLVREHCREYRRHGSSVRGVEGDGTEVVCLLSEGRSFDFGWGLARW